MSRPVFGLGLGLGLALFLALVWPMAWSNLADLNLVRAFDGDEATILEALLRMQSGAGWDPGFYKYGSLYFHLPWLALKLAGGSAFPVLALTLRAASVAGGLVTLALLALAGRRLFGPAAGLAALGLTLALPGLVWWSKTIHPDALALAALTGALGLLLAAVQAGRPRALLWAGLVAGLAVGLKMNSFLLVVLLPWGAWRLAGGEAAAAGWANPARGAWAILALGTGVALLGVALTLLATPERLAKAVQVVALETGRAGLTPLWVRALPWAGPGFLGLGFLTGLAALLARRSGFLASRPRLTAGLSLTAVIAGLFGLGYGLANFVALLRPGFVAEFILNESVRLQRSFAGEPLFFVRLLADGQFWGAWAAGLSALGLALGLVRPRGQGERAAVALLGLWIILNLAHLSLAVAAPWPRHALHLVPALAWLAGLGLARLAGLARRSWLAGLVGLALLAPAVATSLAVDRDYLAESAGRGQSPLVQVGRWLQENYPPQTTLWHDPYLYVPSDFTRAREIWEPSLADLDRDRPAVVVLNQGFFRRYLEEVAAAGVMRPEKRGPAAEYYRALLADGWSGRYRPVKSFGPITVLARGEAQG